MSIDALCTAYCKAIGGAVVEPQHTAFRSALTRCIALTGRFVSAQSWLNALLPAINGGSDTAYRVSCLTVLWHALGGLAPAASASVRAQPLLTQLQLEATLKCLAGSEVYAHTFSDAISNHIKFKVADGDCDVWW